MNPVVNDLSWLDTGAGRPPLVLLHGGFLDHRMWDDQIPAFASRHRVIAPDARGHGKSANPAGPFRLTDDLAALLRHLDTGPAILVGVSMGAGIAVDTALEHPDLVAAVVVSGAGTADPYFNDPWTLKALTAWQSAMAAGDLASSVEAFLTLGAAGPYRTLDEVDPDVVRRLRRMATDTMSKHADDDVQQSSGLMVSVPDAWERATGIEVPVLAINGALDSPDHRAMAGRLADGVSHGQVISIEGAAHYPNMERPDDFNRFLDDFLRISQLDHSE